MYKYSIGKFIDNFWPNMLLTKMMVSQYVTTTFWKPMLSYLREKSLHWLIWLQYNILTLAFCNYSFFHSLMMTSAIWGRNITKLKTINIFLTIIKLRSYKYEFENILKSMILLIWCHHLILIMLRPCISGFYKFMNN